MKIRTINLKVTRTVEQTTFSDDCLAVELTQASER